MAELFRSQVRFFGKHGQYLEALTPDNKAAKDTSLPNIERNKYLFQSVVDIYVLAPLIGYLYQQKAPQDGSEQTKNIFEGALATHHDQLIFSYELLNILDDKAEPDVNERIRIAFCATDELAEKGFALYNEYARGGIEVLYDRLISSASTPEELAKNLMDFIEDYNDKFVEVCASIDLESLLG